MQGIGGKVETDRDNRGRGSIEEEIKTSSSGLRCMCCNVRSIMNNEKRDELQCIMVERKIAVLGITESWTHEEISDAEIKMIGYNVFRKDRNCKAGKKRRVLLFVREELIAHEVEYDGSNC